MVPLLLPLVPFLLSPASASALVSAPTYPTYPTTADATTALAFDATHNTTYRGVVVDGVEKFLGIPYGLPTNSTRRFANPEPFPVADDAVVDATSYGNICPQSNADENSFSGNYSQGEDCLSLKVARPQGVKSGDGLPVMVYIYGGGLSTGNINDPTSDPGGLIQQSVENGLPVIYVAMNYRLSVFGFALSEALKDDNSLNVGMKDQRLALEWVQENICHFGGDPDRVTIFGQSSGGLSVGIQVLAYGGERPVPFSGAIMESTALEPTSTSNLSSSAFATIVASLNCTTMSANGSVSVDSPATLACLRAVPWETLLAATTAQADSTDSDGDIWLPTVDGDFLPAAQSELVRRGAFASNVRIMAGWTEDDATLFLPTTNITTDAAVSDFLHSYWPGLSDASVEQLLALYPASEFHANTTAGLSADFYRAARIFREILLVCPAIYLGEAARDKYLAAAATTNCGASAAAPVFYYVQNQTITEAWEASIGSPGRGVIHTSELPYVFANFTPYTQKSATIAPTASDYALLRRTSRSWSTFAWFGTPSLAGKDTLPGWTPAYAYPNQTDLYVIGGADPGMSALDGPGAKPAVEAQRLTERCAFLNSEEVIRELQY